MPRHLPRKRFGQHFLHDRRVVGRIVDAFDPQPDDLVAEIGPGLGALTRPLLERIAHLHVVEFDRDLVARLRDEFPVARLTVHEADALDFDFRSLAPADKKLRVIGNLPYNISTPLLFHLLEQLEVIEDMLFMLQKEVVDRMAAGCGDADYGRLSVMLQWRLRVEKLFDVAPGAFTPPPKVDSSIVRLVPHATPPVSVSDPVRFAAVVRAAFAQRRKTLRNNLKGIVAPGALEQCGIDPARRAETLSLAEFSRLAELPPGEQL